MLLRPISRPVTPPVVVGLAALTALAVALVSLDFFRRAGRSDLARRPALGTSVASLGLALDAVLLLATHFRYPGLGEDKNATSLHCLCSATRSPRRFRRSSRRTGAREIVVGVTDPERLC